MAVIREVHALDVTDNDVLKAPSRLAAIPYSGTLVLEFSCWNSDADNHWELSLELPDGEVPVLRQRITANGYSSTDHVVHDDTEMAYSFPAYQGGHFLITMEKTGDGSAILVATLTDS